MYLAAHILLLMIVTLIVGIPANIAVLWSPMLTVIALLIGPFWFNPFAFDMDRVKVRSA